jgi:hypothetical protein
MRATQVRLGLFSLGMWVLGSLMVVDAVGAQGGVSFIARQDFGVGSGPASITVGDFNGDGHPDVATANAGADSVSILLGRGDGTFPPAQEFGVGARPGSITVGDFNGDGRPDLATANSFPPSDTASILLGRGDGTFQAAQLFGVGGGPSSITVGDFNGDGRPDLAIAIVTAGTVSILLGNGDGTFQAAQNVGVGGDPVSITVGDFNGDGRLDLAMANGGRSGTVSILLGNGDGTFQAAQVLRVGTTNPPFLASITVGDFNDDGHQDLATAAEALDTVPILLGRGDGTFQVAQEFGVGSVPVFITVGDFNADGRLDLATANGAANSVSILTSGGVVNDLVTFDPLPSSFTFTADPTGCPESFVGTFRFAAQLTNISDRSLVGLVVTVTTLTNGNLLQNADGGPGGVGAQLTVPHTDDFSDGMLSPAELVDVSFVICLQERTPFTFAVDVLGVVGPDEGTGVGPPLLGQRRRIELIRSSR